MKEGRKEGREGVFITEVSLQLRIRLI